LKAESVNPSNRLESKNAHYFANFYENHFNDAGEYVYREGSGLGALKTPEKKSARRI